MDTIHSSGEYAVLWIVNMLQVFGFAFQSRNVNSGAYISAALTSFGLAGLQVLFIKRVIELSLLEGLLVVGSSGACGVVLAMVLWKRTVGRKR